MKSKKALSEIVITMMIVLIAIGAVVTLWVALKPQIQSGAEQAGSLQKCMLLSLSIDSASFNYSGTTNNALVKVKRGVGAGAEIEKLMFIVDGVKIVDINVTTSTAIPQELETKSYKITGLINTTKPGKIELVPVLKGGQLCDVTDSIESNAVSIIN